MAGERPRVVRQVHQRVLIMAASKKPTTTGDIKEADDKSVKYVKVTSPLGSTTTVPDSIVEALLESGYKRA